MVFGAATGILNAFTVAVSAHAQSCPENPNALGTIAAICLLEARSVDEIVAKLTTVELEQVIKIVGRCPRCYPPGAYDALKGHRRTLSPTPQLGERANVGREYLHPSAGRTNPASKRTHQWTPSRRFVGFGAKAPSNASQRATANPFGMTLDYAWTEWAAECGVSETIAAALYLISQNRKAGEVLVKLTLGEAKQVIDIVQRWPDRFPPGTLVALKHSRSASRSEQSPACTSPGAGHRSTARFNSSIGQLHSNGPAPIPRRP